MKTIDARGKLCPVPLIMTKKALNERSGDEGLLILVDNETSCRNVKRFLEEHGMQVEISQKDTMFEITVGRPEHIPEQTNAEAYCSIENAVSGNYVIAFQRDRLGEGDEVLGKMLIWAFIKTVAESDHRPETLVFLNAGIFLLLKDSPALQEFRRLEEAGTRILCCGTCLDFYNKQEELGIGTISNMYEIVGVLSKAGKVLYP
jgi:selenium metabolism protein YedF